MESAGWFVLALGVMSAINVFAFDNRVTPGCSLDAEVCEFSVIVQHRYTMMHYNKNGLGVMLPVTVDGLGRLWTRRKNCSGSDLVPEEEIENVVTADGSYKLMILFNNSLPGPPIVVYQGQQVAVKVINNLENQATTVHFHGMHQRGTPWMDGAEGVSQCGINPRESFTYRFFAEVLGTHWYHSHQGSQRTMGAYGPFIVLPRNPPKSLPKIEDEFLLVLQDYMRRDSLDIFIITTSEAVSWAYGFDSDYCFNSTKQADGFDCGVTPFDSGVINGKGHHYNQRTGDVENAHVPLEVFEVNEGGIYKLRIISAAMTFAFRLSIDGHPLHVMALDGTDVEPVTVESLIVYSGERYDVWFEANDPLEVGNYWIRAVTLERTQNNVRIEPGHTEAILRYDGRPKDEPLTSRAKCTTSSPCRILNCPYQSLPENENSPCIPLSDIRLKEPAPTVQPAKHEDLIEMFLNFHFAGKITEGIWRTTINGRANMLPLSPLQLHRGNISDIVIPCDDKLCRNDICRCSHILDIPLGKTVQFNLAITVSNPDGVLNGNNHPIHIHGYKLQVLKTGWPEYDPVTRNFLNINQDILCNGVSCNDVQWKNDSWNGGNVPGITLKGAPLKDTVVVPIGGYVVTRFKADNPGFWLMHCHTEFHNLEGMSLVVKVGDLSDMTPPPANLHSCGSFSWSSEDFMKAVEGNNKYMSDEMKTTSITQEKASHGVKAIPSENSTEKSQFSFIPVIIASVFIGLILIVSLIVTLRQKGLPKSWKYVRLDTSSSSL